MALERCRRVTAASKLSESRRESELFVGNNAIDATQTRLGPSVVVLVHADERILIYSRGAPPARPPAGADVRRLCVTLIIY